MPDIMLAPVRITSWASSRKENYSAALQVDLSISQWLALDINKVTDSHIPRITQSNVDKTDLPVQLINLPYEDNSKVAVLSWRWDTQEHQVSRNIRSAIRLAKHLGIEYLFTDVLSIDQKLPGDELLKQVIAFSTLYQSIPVIVAYDKIGESLGNTMQRPWIVNEARLYRYNPTKIHYVSHEHHDRWIEPGVPLNPKALEGLYKYEFGRCLEELWCDTMTDTILRVLCGHVGISQESDIKFLLPQRGAILSVAYERMTRNDYLLTAAILCQALSKHNEVDERVDLEVLEFTRFSLRPSRDYKRPSSSWYRFDILLDQVVVVAHWRYKDGFPFSVNNYHYLEPLADAESVIFATLGIGLNQEEIGDARLVDPYLNIFVQSGPVLPEIDIYSVVL